MSDVINNFIDYMQNVAVDLKIECNFENFMRRCSWPWCTPNPGSTHSAFLMEAHSSSIDIGLMLSWDGSNIGGKCRSSPPPPLNDMVWGGGGGGGGGREDSQNRVWLDKGQAYRPGYAKGHTTPHNNASRSRDSEIMVVTKIIMT